MKKEIGAPVRGEVGGSAYGGRCSRMSRLLWVSQQGDLVGHHEGDRHNEEDGSTKCSDRLVPRIGQLYRCRIFGTL